MPDSVTLSNLPYTGFDYGDIYNSLFWVALLTWSFIMARFIIKHSGPKLAQRAEDRKQQKLVTEKRVLMQDPEILEERVIRYTDAAMSLGQNIKQVVLPELDEQVVEKVQNIVERELVVSREGQSPDEFSAEDFATTDFDGVNPDVYWQPRERVQIIDKPPVSVQSAPRVQPPQIPTESIRLNKKYKDSIRLDKSEEYPKIILTREEVVV